MSIKFNIQQVFETEIYYGSYAIYIVGGHYIKVNPDFYVKIINIKTDESIELSEKRLKSRDYKLGKKVVKFYTFQINEYAKFKMSIHNYEDIVVKDSIFEFFPFPFNIPNIVLSKVLGRSRNYRSLDDIEILIE